MMDPKDFVAKCERSGLDFGPVRKAAVGPSEVPQETQRLLAAHAKDTDYAPSLRRARFSRPGRKRGELIRKAGMFAINPATETLDFPQAQSSLTSQNQQQLRGIAKQLFKQIGISKGQLLNALGDTAAWGTENSVAGEIDEDIDPARLKYLAAWLGNRYNQKNVLTFMGHSGGKDLLHDLTVADTDLAGLRKSMDRHGLEYRTIIPARDHIRLMFFDEGGKLAPKIQSFAETHRAQIHSTPGTGEFVGDPAWSSRPKAREQYRKIITDFESQGGNDSSGQAGPPGRPATNSPSGGSVIRGQYYPGGQRLPNPY